MDNETRGTSPASASSSSHSRSTSNSAESGIAFESSFERGDSGPRSLSASASSHEEPPKSPVLAYLVHESQRSPKQDVDIIRLANGNGVPQVQTDDDADTIPLSHLRGKLTSAAEPHEDDRSGPEDDVADILDNWLVEEPRSPAPMKFETSQVDSSNSYGHGALPMTPAVSINGFIPPANDDSPEHASGDDTQAEAKNELPLVLLPLREYIYIEYEPREMFSNLQEVAQGQYGSVYAAHMASGVLGSPDPVVAVKKVPIPANGTPKIGQLRHELGLMSLVRHKHILAADGLFFDFADDTLWIRMELMERSLADVLDLSEVGLVLEEHVIARFASDVSPSPHGLACR